MKNWLYSAETTPALKIVWSGLIGYWMVSLLLHIIKWPHLFDKWGPNSWRYSRDLTEGILAFSILIVLLLLLYKFRDSLSTPIHKVQALGVLFCFLFFPMLDAFFIGLVSEWYTASPERSAASIHLYHRLADVKFYLFILSVGSIVGVIWMMKRQMSQSLRQQSPV